MIVDRGSPLAEADSRVATLVESRGTIPHAGHSFVGDPPRAPRSREARAWGKLSIKSEEFCDFWRMGVEKIDQIRSPDCIRISELYTYLSLN